jgi:hypothetical protein
MRVHFHLSFLILLLVFSSPWLSAQPDQVQTLHASTSLVLVDVIANDPKTGLPVPELTKSDFRPFDNGRAMTITTFDAGSRYETRPIALWLVVICNERGLGKEGIAGSGPFVGNEPAFRPGLDYLDKPDRVGVAHWCDNGDAQLDLVRLKIETQRSMRLRLLCNRFLS